MLLMPCLETSSCCRSLYAANTLIVVALPEQLPGAVQQGKANAENIEIRSLACCSTLRELLQMVPKADFKKYLSEAHSKRGLAPRSWSHVAPVRDKRVARTLPLPIIPLLIVLVSEVAIGLHEDGVKD